MKRLPGKVAIITGGSAKLGRAIAEAFAAEGAALFLVGRDAKALAAAANELSAAEVGVLAIDLTGKGAAEAVVAAAQERFGRADILVNAAGAFFWKKFVGLSEEDWRVTLDTNLSAPFFLTHAFARALIAAGRGGAVINIASIHGMVPDANVVPQCAAKLGLIGLTRACAEALRPNGIRVNAISPGSITPNSPTALSTDLMSKVTQADVAQMALYLASDAASAITGTNLEAYGVTRPIVAQN